MKKFSLFLLPVFGIALLIAARKGEASDEKFDIKKVVFCAPSFDPAKMAEGNAPLLKGLGKLNYRISTKSKKAQQYFNQGLSLLYGFNHGEAGRSFKTALRYDSTLAIAHWGVAMVLGPNYNAGLNPTRLVDINAAIDNAIRLSGNAMPHEKALINAMASRFPREEVKDMAPYYEAYAASMGEAYRQFPEDPEIATLYADALMNLHPWNLWLKDGTAQPWTAEIMLLIEKTLANWPKHPGAIHYYIHATEASKEAEKAMPYADKLADISPAAGHLVHMPAHTYIRTGDYHKGVVVTEKAAVADSMYIAQCKVQGAYPMLYYPHNIHFLAACAFFEGSSKKAIDAAWMVSRKSDLLFLYENVTIQHFYIIPYYVMIHMGKWNDILQLQQPDKRLKYPVAIWHYARGMAMAAQGKLPQAQKELDAVKEIARDETLATMLIWDMNTAQNLVHIAAHTLEGELLGYRKQYDEAVVAFNKAIAIEDNLAYTEPPDWFFSVRHSLGHWLVQAGRFGEAEKVYRQDLETYKENGWSLMGLYNSLLGQNKKEEAKSVKDRFDRAWQYADMKISSSRKY